jgi:hypothetical protein
VPALWSCAASAPGHAGGCRTAGTTPPRAPLGACSSEPPGPGARPRVPRGATLRARRGRVPRPRTARARRRGGGGPRPCALGNARRSREGRAPRDYALGGRATCHRGGRTPRPAGGPRAAVRRGRGCHALVGLTLTGGAPQRLGRGRPRRQGPPAPRPPWQGSRCRSCAPAEPRAWGYVVAPASCTVVEAGAGAARALVRPPAPRPLARLRGSLTAAAFASDGRQRTG